jgi:DNA (cytosine-5)-methyltransferase 1
MNDRFPISFSDVINSDLTRSLREKSWPSVTALKGRDPLRIVDLFSGCGGLTLGAFQASMNLGRLLEISLAVDNSQAALDVFSDNFDRFSKRTLMSSVCELVIEGDYSNLSEVGGVLATELDNIDVLLAGPPCQGNSDLNNRSRRNDPRNDLYLIPAVFASKALPKIILIENVPSVIHGASEVVLRAKQALRNAKYACTEFNADLTGFGLPQSRRRHVLVASLLHTDASLKEALSSVSTSARNIPLYPFISDLDDDASLDGPVFSRHSRPSIANKARIDVLFNNDLFDLPNSFRPSCHRDKQHSYVSMYGRLNAGQPSQTITSGFGSMGQGRFIHPTQRRTITPHEAARIQGFPDYFSFARAKSLTALRKMIANAVAPVVSSTLITALLRK